MAGEEDPNTPIEDSEDKALPSLLVQFNRFSDADHFIWPDTTDPFFRALRESIES
jgi:hypothetical protein